MIYLGDSLGRLTRLGEEKVTDHTGALDAMVSLIDTRNQSLHLEHSLLTQYYKAWSLSPSGRVLETSDVLLQPSSISIVNRKRRSLQESRRFAFDELDTVKRP